MQWSPEVAARIRYRRADVNRRMSERYSPRVFQEKNQILFHKALKKILIMI